MRIITINLNGIRSAARKGFFDWIATQNADIICMQELKAQEADIQDALFSPAGYHAYFHYAEKKGYSGVGIYTRTKPRKVVTGLGWDFADQEGRYVAIDLDGLWVSSLYMPSGTSSEDRQTVKYDFLSRFKKYLASMQDASAEMIICGDWNIAHKKIDLKNWQSNQKNSGFLPDERAWLDVLFGEMGFVDAFRLINQEPDQYTWWSNRRQSFNNNVGWRIDYQVITPGLAASVKSVHIYKEQRFSDHAPLIVDYA